MIYCTADIITWTASTAKKRVLMMYGGAKETHEFSFDTQYGQSSFLSGTGAKVQRKGLAWVVQWQVTLATKVVRIPGCNLEIRMLWRIDAYNYGFWNGLLQIPSEITPHRQSRKLS